MPISVHQARDVGLIDDVIIQDNYGVNNFRQFKEQIRRIAARSADEELAAGLTKLKRAIRSADEDRKPLAQYRREELEEMRRNFWGSDQSYHLARSAFVRKRPLKSILIVDPATNLAAIGADAGGMRRAKDRLRTRPLAGRARSGMSNRSDAGLYYGNIRVARDSSL